MKKTAILTASAFLASLAFTGFALAAGEYGKSEQKQTGAQSKQPAASGQTQAGMQAGQQQIRTASDIQKFNVQTAAGEKLGKIDKVVVDLEQGRIGYIIVSAAQGSDKYVIPWKALRSEPQQQSLILNMTTAQLQQAPKGDIQLVQDRQKGREIHQFFGVSPYWEETGMQQQRQPGSMQQPDQSQQPGSMQQPGQQQQPKRPGSSM